MIELTDGMILLRPMTLADVDAHLAGEDELIQRFASGGVSTRKSVSAWIAATLDAWEHDGPVRGFGIYEAATVTGSGFADSYPKPTRQRPASVGNRRTLVRRLTFTAIG